MLLNTGANLASMCSFSSPTYFSVARYFWSKVGEALSRQVPGCQQTMPYQARSPLFFCLARLPFGAAQIAQTKFLR